MVLYEIYDKYSYVLSWQRFRIKFYFTISQKSHICGPIVTEGQIYYYIQFVVLNHKASGYIFKLFCYTQHH